MAKDDGKTRHTHNAPPSELPSGAPVDAVRAEFARRLQRLIVDKGWSQVELANRASLHLPKDKVIGRDSISQYINALSFPTPIRLKAIAKALGVEAEYLRPVRGVKQAGAPTLEVRETEDGGVWLRVNQHVDWPTAAKVIELLKVEEK